MRMYVTYICVTDTEESSDDDASAVDVKSKYT